MEIFIIHKNRRVYSSNTKQHENNNLQKNKWKDLCNLQCRDYGKFLRYMQIFMESRKTEETYEMTSV